MDTNGKGLQSFKCNNCGAAIQFKSGTNVLICDYCNSEHTISSDPNSPSIENELDLELYLDKLESENLRTEKVINCKKCGVVTSVPDNLNSLTCIYCKSRLEENDISDGRFVKPGYLIPFVIKGPEVTAALEKWIKGSWFVPIGLKSAILSPKSFRAVYVPYWLYDVSTQSYYSQQSGIKGDNHTVSVSINTADPTKIKPDLDYGSNSIVLPFKDILVPATRNINADFLYNIGPWDKEAMVAPKEEYLNGYVIQKYSIKLKEGFKTAKSGMSGKIKEQIGNELLITDIHTTYNDLTFKGLLVPIYISSYRYGTTTYRFYVNGQNGKVAGGSIPISIIKIIGLCILAFLIFIAYMSYKYPYDPDYRKHHPTTIKESSDTVNVK